MSSALHSMDEADTFGEAGGHAVDYDTLPYAIVPVMKDLFNAPLTIEEENYALEVKAVHNGGVMTMGASRFVQAFMSFDTTMSHRAECVEFYYWYFV